MAMSRIFVSCLVATLPLLAACSPSTPQPAPGSAAQSFRVVGTEPFWGVRVDGDALHFTTVDDQVGKRLRASPAPQPNGVRYAGHNGGTAFQLDLTRGACSDGMSDKEYAFTATFRYGQANYQGCAEAQ
jgi:uncharacterized membrane protein